MPGLTVTVRFEDEEKKVIPLSSGSNQVSTSHNSYRFITPEFLRSVPDKAMAIIVEGRKNNSHNGSVVYRLKTNAEVMRLLATNGNRGKPLVGADPYGDEDDVKYWVSDQNPPTISPDLRNK